MHKYLRRVYVRSQKEVVALTVIDLYAGPGGWDVAARILGLDPIGVEWDKAARETREANGLTTAEEGDVRKFFDLIDFPVTGAIASPPCQTFSLSGRGAGRRALDDVLLGVAEVAAGREVPTFDDERTALVLEPLRYALAFKPRWLAWEQVPTVLPVWEACAEVLRSRGYRVWTGKLHAEEYGVPQTRTRAVLIASLDREVGKPQPTHTRYVKGGPRQAEGLLPWVSMSGALGRGMTDRPSMTVTGGGTYTGGAEPFGNGARKGMVREMDAGRWLPQHAVEGDETSLEWTDNRPSPTIVGSFEPDVVAAPGYRKAGDGPRQKAPGSVRVSLQEAAVLQSFPPDYVFKGARTKQFQQVGNAVPPRLALHILAEALGYEEI